MAFLAEDSVAVLEEAASVAVLEEAALAEAEPRGDGSRFSVASLPLAVGGKQIQVQAQILFISYRSGK